MACAFVMLPLSLGVAACSGTADPLSAAPYDATDQVVFNGGAGGAVHPDQPLEITSTTDDGRIVDVSAVDTAGRRVSGELSKDGSRWHSTGPLAAGTRYTVQVGTENGDGAPGRRTLTFRTQEVKADRLAIRFGPESGTYGVGQPLTAKLNHKVSSQRERAVVERSLKVTSQPAVRGSWYWVDDRTLHYRPPEFWPARSTISVRSNLEGLRIRKGLYGGSAKPLRIRTADRIEATTDISRHTMTFKRNGKTVRSIPVTTGKEGFRTRNGIKVILGKEEFVRMRGSSVGIPAGSAEGYDLPVYWAARVTWSGEYVHGAPWSAGSHGNANVSHGCTGMSSENARWFFENVRRGDVVRYVGGDGEDMTPFDNGFGDWNLSWKEWSKGSAL